MHCDEVAAQTRETPLRWASLREFVELQRDTVKLAEDAIRCLPRKISRACAQKAAARQVRRVLPWTSSFAFAALGYSLGHCNMSEWAPNFSQKSGLSRSAPSVVRMAAVVSGLCPLGQGVAPTSLPDCLLPFFFF